MVKEVGAIMWTWLLVQNSNKKFQLVLRPLTSALIKFGSLSWRKKLVVTFKGRTIVVQWTQKKLEKIFWMSCKTSGLVFFFFGYDNDESALLGVNPTKYQRRILHYLVLPSLKLLIKERGISGQYHRENQTSLFPINSKLVVNMDSPMFEISQFAM